MSRREKQIAELAVLEAELQGRLEGELKRVACGADSLFFTTREFNPHQLPEHRLPKISEELSRLTSKALELREQLGEPVETSIGALFRRALQRCADLSDHHRPGPSHMAQELLAEIREQRGS